MSPPAYAEDGTPVVTAPDSILLHASRLWKGYLVAHFHGLAPPPQKIFADLNPIWGKSGNIIIRPSSSTSCLIFIPSVSTREWVLQIGYWQAGNCGFSVTPWDPSGNLQVPEPVSVPIWAVLKNIPPQLFSLDGISVIASAIGEPLHTEKSKLEFSHLPEIKVKVEVMLKSKLPEQIKIKDKDGNSATVNVSYPRPPLKCINCQKFGHLISRCPLPIQRKVAPPQQTPVDSTVSNNPTSSTTSTKRRSRSRSTVRSQTNQRSSSSPPTESQPLLTLEVPGVDTQTDSDANVPLDTIPPPIAVASAEVKEVVEPLEVLETVSSPLATIADSPQKTNHTSAASDLSQDSPPPPSIEVCKASNKKKKQK